MHVNAVEKNPLSFEHIPAESVGNTWRILVSELSGGSNVLLKAVEMGVALTKSSPEVRQVLRGASRNWNARGTSSRRLTPPSSC